MRERWVDDVVGPGEAMPPRFDERLRDELSAMWVDAAEFVPIDRVERDHRSPGRWRRGSLAAAAVAGITVAAVVTRDPSVTRDAVHGPAPALNTTFDSLPGPVEPITREAVVDVTWLVDSIDAQPPESEPAWFRLEADGTVRGFDGCSRYGADFTLDGAQLRVGRSDDFSQDGCRDLDWHSTRIASGTLTLAGGQLIAPGTDSSEEGAAPNDVELRAMGIETLPAVAASVPGRYVDQTITHEILFRADGTIVEPGADGCGQIGRWSLDDGLVVESDVDAANDRCGALAVDGRGGITDGGTIFVFNTIDDRLPKITTFRLFDTVVAMYDYALDVVVPPDGGEPLRPEVFANVASDAGTEGHR